MSVVDGVLDGVLPIAVDRKPASSGVLLDAIFETNSLDDVFDEVRSIEASPSLLCCLGELENHGEACSA